MYNTTVETLVLEVTCESGCDNEDKHVSDQVVDRDDDTNDNTVEGFVNVSPTVSNGVDNTDITPIVDSKQGPLVSWNVRKPSRTYQRQFKCQRIVQNVVNPIANLSSSIDLRPVKDGDAVGKHCIPLRFPSCKTYSFEQSQDLMLLQLNSPHMLDDGKDAETSDSKKALCTFKDQILHVSRKQSRRKVPKPKKSPKQCEFCGKLYLSPRTSHLESCTSIQHKTPCPDCGKIFASVKTLRRHQTLHSHPSREKRHRCNICEKLFSSGRCVRRHMLIHNGEKPHKCQICGRPFREKNQLSYHTTTHTGIKKLTCTGCGKQFMYPSIMKLHKCRHD